MSDVRCPAEAAQIPMVDATHKPGKYAEPRGQAMQPPADIAEPGVVFVVSTVEPFGDSASWGTATVQLETVLAADTGGGEGMPRRNVRHRSSAKLRKRDFDLGTASIAVERARTRTSAVDTAVVVVPAISEPQRLADHQGSGRRCRLLGRAYLASPPASLRKESARRLRGSRRLTLFRALLLSISLQLPS